MENSTTIIAGGMEINVTGNNIQFTIGEFKHITTLAKMEEMLASHEYLKDACLQILYAQKSGDAEEFSNGLQSAKEALHRSGISMHESIGGSGDDDLPF